MATRCSRGGEAGGRMAIWRTRGGAAAHAEVLGAATAPPAAASVSSSSLASAQERVPSRIPLIMGSASPNGEMVLNRASSPLEPSPKLSAG
jgi:hypothetical protein